MLAADDSQEHAAHQEHAAELPDWVPEGIDITVQNPARMYDYMLGGCHNFAVDREYADKAEQILPGRWQVAYANRAFLGRAVRWLASMGIRQFLDIGSGIPTVGNVHEIAEQAADDVRVMYVDIDPVAVAHTRAILAGHPRVRVLQADLHRPLDIVRHPDVTDLLDFSKPIAVVLAAVLHFISEADDPYAIVGQLRDSVVSGSYIALSHATQPAEQAEELETIRQTFQRSPVSLHYRSLEQVARLLTGMDIVEPGIVPTADWHPADDESASGSWSVLLAAAVARKP
jgi:S-adenosyl methyltransferase